MIVLLHAGDRIVAKASYEFDGDWVEYLVANIGGEMEKNEFVVLGKVGSYHPHGAFDVAVELSGEPDFDNPGPEQYVLLWRGEIAACMKWAAGECDSMVEGIYAL